MPLPGAEIDILDVAPPPGDVADTGLQIALGQATRGPDEPTEVQSYGDLIAKFGPRQPSGVLHDTLETAFATGLARAIVVRVTGPDAAPATLNLAGATGTSLTATAASVGAWGNGLKIQIVDAGTSKRRLVVLEGAVTLEQSPAATTRAELLTWAQDQAQYVKLAAGADTGLPSVAAAASMTGGDDDTAAIDATSYQAALDKLTPEHGTGQLTAPGVSDEDVHLALLQKAGDPACQRFAPLDADPTWDASQKAARAATLTAAGYGQWGTMVTPRVRVPAPGGGIRFVPASGFWCGRASFTDATVGVGQPPAGELYGQSDYILDVEETYTDAERDTLNEAGIIVIARVNGSPRIYGARTLADTDTHPAYRWVNGTRAVLRFRALAQQILERYVLRRIDSKRSILVGLSNDLNALAEQERAASNIYGATPAEAYRVDTRYPSVNTDATLAGGWLKAVAEIRTAPVAERVRLDLTVRSPADTIPTV